MVLSLLFISHVFTLTSVWFQAKLIIWEVRIVESRERYAEVSIKTADNLRTIAQTADVRELSRLSLPEIDAITDLVGRIVPAGNVPGVIVSGLARLPGRRPPSNIVKRDVNLLFRGVEQVLDRAAYGAFFAGPAAVIWAYQNLLKLAGKAPEDSFPDGTWQFYVEYALREDTARHANETHGFDTALNLHNLKLSLADRMTAWVLTAIRTLQQYDDLLTNEWRERVYRRLLADITAQEPDAARYAHLYRDWQKQLPYQRGTDATASEPYPVYRRIRFDRFLAQAMRDLPAPLRQQWEDQRAQAEGDDLPAYQQQMSILSYLDPGPYGETRTPIAFAQAHIGVIYQGRYYLIPACHPQTDQPADVDIVREQIAALLTFPSDAHAAHLIPLATVKRAALPGLRSKLDPSLVDDLDRLKLTPVLLNFDSRSPHLPLAALRQAERGIGDHALTVFDTGSTFVFDQSHIFFDGAWGAALAEIMTNEALSWAVYLHGQPPAQPGTLRPYSPDFHLSHEDVAHIAQAPHVTPEASAETDAVNIKAILALRKLFRRRSDLLQLTVNDLLVLYRAIHAVIYQPAPDLMDELDALTRRDDARSTAEATLATITRCDQVPATLIPVDASLRSPRDRLYPMTFEVPLRDLDLISLHGRVIDALDAYEQAARNRSGLYAAFDELQRTYLATLAGFGTVLSKAKEIALAGESVSIGTIKLLAHISPPLQHLLDQVPGQFDVLNDIIKGREIFSNVGAVAPTSTLTRFITAKDDNDKKTLAWGVITDAHGTLRLSLRDFRLHVAALQSLGRRDLAVRIAEDYLEAYAQGLNEYVHDLHRITRFSRETRLIKPEEING
jgi:hypothetical protein